MRIDHHRLAISLITAAVFVARIAAAEEPLKPVADDFNDNEFPSRPAPAWVEIVDQGETNPKLQGLKTPKGIKVEVVAEEPVSINPVGLSFDDAGNSYVIEWRHADEAKHITYPVKFKDGTESVVNRMWKPTKDELKQYLDVDGDGVFDSTKTLMSDLEIPSMTFLHDGWFYLPSIGHVIRRRQSLPDGRFDIEEEIIRGLCGYHHHQVSGLTLSNDGWMFISSGDDDNRGEGSDGSRATILRTGAILRSKPDGSQLHEFARGFRNPYRDVAFDDTYNMFHVDNDQEDGSKFQGVRLMHILEGADYGWRLLPGAVCCRTDFARGAVFGEKPGKMPSMFKTGRGAPAGLLIYQGTRFPDFFRGLLIYPDVYRKMVRAFRIEPDGATFKVVEQFVLMQSEDALFRPCEAVVGPDGAIYIVDWRTDSGGAGRLWGDAQHGRIYRLTWGGTADAPAIPRGPMDAWAKIRTANDDELWTLLDDPDFEIRTRAQQELVRRGDGNREGFIAFARDPEHTLPGRAVAIGAAAQFWNDDVAESMTKLLFDSEPDVRRLAADAISRNAKAGDPHLAQHVVFLKDLLSDFRNPGPRRAAALALGSVASLLPEDDPQRKEAAEALLAHLRGRRDWKPAETSSDKYLRDGFLRGLERLGKTGIDLLVERARSKDANDRAMVVHVFQALRTREGAEGLDRVLGGDTSNFTDEEMAAILSGYRYIQVEPPISAAAVATWLESHPDAGTVAKVAALETIGLDGTVDAPIVIKVASELIDHQDEATRLAAIQVIGDSRLNTASKQLITALKDTDRTAAERRAIVAALSKLRKQDNPPRPEGVEAVLDELAAIAGDREQGEVQPDALALVAQINFEKAEPVARALLRSDDATVVSSAITILGSRPETAREIGQMFVEGKIDRAMLSRVSEVLQRHAESDKSGEILKLLSEVFRGGLIASLQETDVKRVESLVSDTGDSARGRSIFLDPKKAQCATCHKLEGVGGQVGPDLSKISETHTVAKLMESLLDPSKEIKEGYSTWTALTVNGQVYNGLKISSNETETVLRDSAGKDVRLQQDEIDEIVESKKSLMPEGVVAQLSLQDFIDLVAFLKDRDAQLELARQNGTSPQGEGSR